MKCLVTTLSFLFLFTYQLFAQVSLTGHIVDADDANKLTSATIKLEGEKLPLFTASDANGVFQLRNLKKGTYQLSVSYVGYATYKQVVDLQKDAKINIRLSRSVYMADEVVVNATRANDKSAMAFSHVTADEIKRQNLGQDLPVLLNFTPSMVTTSDAGAGVGYTGMRIRGTDATRINVTLNGIPMNDAESQGTYWVDLPDFASSASNIQIQRGVGTSTNGAGAFGASVNIQTNTFRKEPYAEINTSAGSFKTFKTTIMAGTGLLNNHFTVDARLSKISSDGYIDCAFSDLKSFYLSGGYFGKKSFVRLNVFSGTERTYQSWYGTPESRVNNDVAGMNAYIERNYLSDAEAKNLLNSGRTYNYYTYDNQTDNYQQDYYQLLSSHTISSTLTFNANLHYTKGKGYYEEFKNDAKLSNYDLPNVVVGTETIKRTDLVRRKWLDNDFYGTTFSLDYDSHSKLKASVGGAWNQYAGKHFGEVIWAKFAPTSNVRQRYYEDDALKTDFNLYAKAYYQFNDQLNIFADMQVRKVGYSFLGFNSKLQNVQQSADLTFFNPKVGLTYQVSDRANTYISYSVGNKEPNRDDYTQSTPESRPKAENLQDIELGYRIRTAKVAFSINGYYMYYKNQLVLTGQLNDVGAYNRTNVPDSYRAGIELEGSVLLCSKLKWNANVTLSQNKIKEFTEYLDDYDNGNQKSIVYKNTDIAFSPNVIVGSQLFYTPLKNLEIGLLTKYVGKQYLDNTSSESRIIKAYFTNDIRATYSIKPQIFKEIVFSLLLNNIFDSMYSSNGYTWGYVAGGQTVRENFYYPQAGRNFLLGVSLKF
jgi:iron complex outermembrane recepter protein